MIVNADMQDEGATARIVAHVPLAEMFGYSTDLRSSTQGKGEFSMVSYLRSCDLEEASLLFLCVTGTCLHREWFIVKP